MSDLRAATAEAIALARNGPASDGHGWYRNEGDRIVCFEYAEAVLAAVEPLLRAKHAKEVAARIESAAAQMRDESYNPATGVALAAVLVDGARIAREYGERG